MSLNILNTTEPEGPWSYEVKAEGSSDGTQSSPEMGGCVQRKKSLQGPKSFLKSGRQASGAGRRRAYRAGSVDDMELCAKRMKYMSLQDHRSPKISGVPTPDIDDGYEGDVEA